MKKIKNWAILSTILFVIVLISYCILNFSCYEKTASLFSALLGVISSISFGVWVSYAFQNMNDKAIKKKNDELIAYIREREFSKLRFNLSLLVRSFHMYEDQLIHKLKTVKLNCSFTESDIDIENITLNYFIFMDIYENIDKYFDNETDKNSVKLNIDCLLMRDKTASKQYEGTWVEISSIYCAFNDFNLICVELSKKMPQINIDLKLDVFKPEEIVAINAFSKEIGIGCFTNFYPPYEIIHIFTKLLDIQSFVKADFVPYYKSDKFLIEIQDPDKEKKEFENMVDDWMTKNTKNAAERLGNVIAKSV